MKQQWQKLTGGIAPVLRGCLHAVSDSCLLAAGFAHVAHQGQLTSISQQQAVTREGCWVACQGLMQQLILQHMERQNRDHQSIITAKKMWCMAHALQYMLLSTLPQQWKIPDDTVHGMLSSLSQAMQDRPTQLPHAMG
jgi:hypothetical protein